MLETDTCRGSMFIGNGCGHCTKCLAEIERLQKLIKSENKESKSEDFSDVSDELSGWLCPRCGRGNSPYTGTCPCIPL